MSSSSQNNIKTFARLRPLARTTDQKIFFKKNQQTVNCTLNHEEFRFNEVFDEQSQNNIIFKATCSQMIQHNFQGYNSCILAYGQTSSGKTFTMKGSKENPGIIPLCIESIFQKIYQNKLVAQLFVSYFQIYNQNVFDLLAQSQNVPLNLREDKRNLVINDLTQTKVNKSYQAMELFQLGQSNRKFADNNINQKSSRSHVIFKIILKIAYQEGNQIKQTYSQINMVDLAGSEGVCRTRAQGNLKKQGENINKSILALSNVIRSMSDKKDYTNFRDSKLTRILQNSLCQNSKSIIICTLNTNAQNIQESLNTLKFCNTASKVEIVSKQNMTCKQTQAKFREQQWPQNSNNNENGLKNQLQKLKHQIIQNETYLVRKQKQCQDLKQDLLCLRQQMFKLNYQKQSLQDKLLEINNQINYNNIRFTQFQVQKHIKEKQQYKQNYFKYKAKHDDLVDQYNTTAKNQKYLVDQINDFKEEIASLKMVVQKQSLTTNIDKKKQVHQQRKKNPFYGSPYRSPHRSNDRIPVISLNTIVQLKGKIIHINLQLAKNIQQNVNLNKQINQLRINNANLSQALQRYQGQSQNSKSMSKSYRPIKQIHQNAQNRQIKKLNRKIKQLRSQVSLCQQRQQKALKKLKKFSQINRNLFDQYQIWKLKTNQYVSKEVQTSQCENLIIQQPSNSQDRFFALNKGSQNKTIMSSLRKNPQNQNQPKTNSKYDAESRQNQNQQLQI